MSNIDTGRVVPPPVFLERQSYRRRRLMDAARLLPVFGALVFAIPLLWATPEAADIAAGDDQPVRMSFAIFYVFISWAVLIGVSVLFGLSARKWGQSDSQNLSDQD